MTKKLKLVREVDDRKIEMIVYAAFFVGFMANQEGRSISAPMNFDEIKKLIEQF